MKHHRLDHTFGIGNKDKKMSVSRRRDGKRKEKAAFAVLTVAALVVVKQCGAHTAVNSNNQSSNKRPLVHTVIASGCSKYFDWQVMTFVYRCACQHKSPEQLLLASSFWFSFIKAFVQ
jgi:hypothetical protein